MDWSTRKNVLITGGSDGIGFGIATAFAKNGKNLVLVGRDREKLAQKETFLQQYDINVFSISADMSSNECVLEIAENVRAKAIQIDILINNAGIARFVPFADTDKETLDYHLNLNVKAPYLLTQAFLDDLIASRGNVINISSYFAKRMLPDRPSTAYSLTKGALESFTSALAFELGPGGVRVNAIAPGTIDTPQFRANMEQLDNQAKNRFNLMIQSVYPLQKIGKPEDIANMAVFLASDQAAWITGGIFSVDGGLTTN